MVRAGGGHVVTDRHQVVQLGPQARRAHFQAQALDACVDLGAACFQHRGQGAHAAAIGGDRGARALCGQRQQRAVVAGQALAVATPFLQHRQCLGHMGTCGFLALGAFLLDIGELGGQLAVLAVLLVPLQRDRNIERDHVRVGRAALAVHQLDAHIGLLVGLRDVGFGLRDFFLLLHHGDFRVMGQLGLQVLRAQANRIQCRSRTQGIAGGRTYPAGQLRAGRGDLALGLFDAVVDLGDGRSGGEHIGLRAAPASVSSLGGVDLQARFVALGHQHVAHALLVETVQPGQGGVALQVGKRQAAPGLGDPGLALVASGAGP